MFVKNNILTVDIFTHTHTHTKSANQHRSKLGLEIMNIAKHGSEKMGTRRSSCGLFSNDIIYIKNIFVGVYPLDVFCPIKL